MTLQRRHTLSARFVTPELIRYQEYGLGNVSSVVVTPAVAPVAGNILLVTVGGAQIRTPTCSEWNSIATASGGLGTNEYLYKIATSSEPATYTFSFGSGLQGMLMYYEIAKADFNTYSVEMQAPAVGTSKIYTAYNILAPSIMIGSIVESVSSVGTSINNSFTMGTDITRYIGAYRVYNGRAVNESTTWTHPSTNAAITRVIFRGRKRNF